MRVPLREEQHLRHAVATLQGYQHNVAGFCSGPGHKPLPQSVNRKDKRLHGSLGDISRRSSMANPALTMSAGFAHGSPAPAMSVRNRLAIAYFIHVQRCLSTIWMRHIEATAVLVSLQCTGLTQESWPFALCALEAIS